jgi:hypothetical protein
MATLPEERSKKRKRGFAIDELRMAFETEPNDYKLAWEKLRTIVEEIETTTPRLPTV